MAASNSYGFFLALICFVSLSAFVVALKECDESSGKNNDDCEPKFPVKRDGKCDVDSTLCAPSFSSSKAPPTCKPSGYLHGRSHTCNHGGQSSCCKSGQTYPQYKCSPPIEKKTAAILTLNCFQRGGCGGGPSECDNRYHSDQDPVVALSTGWFASKKHCMKEITIFGNGHSVKAMVVDECDSVRGCDKQHNFEPPCAKNIVDASAAVWEALKVSSNSPNYGYMPITWSLD